MKKLLIRLQNWEYWPFSILYFPVFFYYGWLSLKERSLFFFTSSNPSIEFGGMMGEKKSEIFKLIPEDYLPTTFLVKVGDLANALMASVKLGFPLIAKPNIGERGTWVQKLVDKESLKRYVQECPVDFLLQELVTYPLELGVFYVRRPDENVGMISSIVQKEFLKVVGDGKSTIMELLQSNPRALMTANLESQFLLQHGANVPDLDEVVVIEPIGNHCRGTLFLNDTPKVDAELIAAIDKLAKEIPDFYFGRFDLRCASYESLKKLKEFKILELNGAGSEPAHIYQPGFSLFKAYQAIFWHLSILADISRLNKRRGVPYWSFRRGLEKWKEHQRYMRCLQLK